MFLSSSQLRGRLRVVCLALAGFLLLLFGYAAARRVGYPYELEWIESNMLVSTLRIAHGQGLYVAPTLRFVPYLYAPLYLYIAAGVSHLVHGYAALRLVSILSTLGACGAIYALVRTEVQGRFAAVVAAGFYVGCYSALDSFFDIGRVDSLFVFLLLLALLAQRRGYPVVAALVWALVFQTKQTVLPLGVAILAAEWLRGQPRRAAASVAVLLVAVATSVLLLNRATGGWYSFYVFHVARGLPIVWRQAALYVPQYLVGAGGVAWATILAAVALTRPRLRSALFAIVVSAVLYGGLWFVTAHRGASMNALMPAYAWTAILFGIAVGRLLGWAEAQTQPAAVTAVLLAVATQLLVLVYNPGRYVPSAAQRQATEQFIARLRGLPGDVYVLNHSYDAVQAGKQPHAEGEALGAVLDAKLGATSADLRAELDATLAAHRYSAVVIDDVQPRETSWHFERQYPRPYATTLQPYRALTSQPAWFLLPCGAEATGLAEVPELVDSGMCAAGQR